MVRAVWRHWLGLGHDPRHTRGTPQSGALSHVEMLDPREAYARWAEAYPPRPHNPLMAVEQAMVEPMLADVRATRALDLGTGTGRNLPLLARTGARTVVGLDMSPEMLAHCELSRRLIRADACRLPFRDGRFDVVCSSLMLGDIVDLDGWVRETARVVARGGHLIYSDFHPSWALRKWRRTFTAADGRSFELKYFAHTMDEHLAALERERLRVQTIREPRIGGIGDPVVVVFHAVKDRG
jgi:SAM-dependent methyltransferase